MRLSGELKAILGVASLALVVGCGNSSPNQGSGAAGSGGGGAVGTGVAGTGSGETAGTDGQIGIGGTGGVPRPHVELPTCVKDLIAACPTTGACVTVAVSNTGVPMPYCFANGVRAVVEAYTTNGAQVSKPDGSPCYTYDRMGDGGVWKDPAGNVVATATLLVDSRQYVQLQITCAVGGETQVCDGGFIRSNTCCISPFGQVDPLVYPQCNGGQSCDVGTCS